MCHQASTGAAMESLAQQSAEGFLHIFLSENHFCPLLIIIKLGEDMLEFKLEKENSPETEFRDPFTMPMVTQSQMCFCTIFRCMGHLPY